MRPRLLLGLVLCFNALVASAVSAAQTRVPVIIDGKTVIEVQWGYGTFSPAIRAKAITQRLIDIAQDPSLPSTVTIELSEKTLDLVAGDRIIASVFDGDAEAAGVPRELVARQWQRAFKRAIEQYRTEHSREMQVKRFGLTVLTVVLAVVVLWVLLKALRWASDRLSALIVERMRRSRKQEVSLIDTHEVASIVRLLGWTLRVALVILVLYVTFHVLFLLYPQTRAIGDAMRQSVMKPLRQLWANTVASTPGLILVAIIAVVCRYLLHLASFAFAQIRIGRVRIEGFKPRWAPVTRKLLSILIVVLGVLIAYPYIPGSQSPAFKSVSLFFGVLLSLGSTGVVSNVLNGIVLTYMDSFAVGDYIQIGETSGYVESTSLFVTRLRNRQGRLITIPNSEVLSNQITNFSMAAGEKTLSLSVNAGIGYDTPWRQVEAILLNAARKTRTVKESPAPFVLELSLDSFQVMYELTVFLTGEARINQVAAELRRNMLDEFNLYGIQILTPSYMADPPRPAVVPKENWYAAPAKKEEGQHEDGARG
jgi:small-conductance mechanosensitive channel